MEWPLKKIGKLGLNLLSIALQKDCCVVGKIYSNSDWSWFWAVIRNDLSKASPTPEILCEEHNEAWKEAQMEWRIRPHLASDSSSVLNGLVRD